MSMNALANDQMKRMRRLLKDCPDIVSEFEPGEMLAEIVHVYDVKDRKCEVYDDIAEEHLLITC